jgi:hypothetical protein
VLSSLLFDNTNFLGSSVRVAVAKGFNVSKSRKTPSVEKIRFSLGGDFKMDFNKKRQMFDKAFTIDELIHHKRGDRQ